MNLLFSNFMLGFELAEDNTVKLLDDELDDFHLDYMSSDLKYYLKVSEASNRLREEVISHSMSYVGNPDENSLVTQILETDIKTFHRGIYTLCQIVVTECYTLQYILGEDKSYLIDLNTYDLQRLRENIRYLANWFGYFRKYRHLIEYFRELDIAVGYMENQLNLLLNSTDLGQSRGILNY